MHKGNPRADPATGADRMPERERILQHLTNNTGRPVLYFDAEHYVRFVNQPFQQWIGLAESEILARHASEIFAGGGYEFYLPFLNRALAGETSTVETVSYARKAGARHIRVSFFPDSDDRGNAVGIYIIALDIEDDYQLRQSLIEKERELRSIADNIGMPMSKSDRNLRYLYVNRVACEWFAQTEEEIVGQTWAEVIGAQQFAAIEGYARRALEGEAVSYERLATFPGHPPGHIRVTINPYRDYAGEVAGLYVIITDIEQEYRRKQEIIDRERQLQLFTDNIPESIAYIDNQRRYKFVNNTFLRQRGRARQDVIGKTTEEVLGTEAARLADPHVAQALAGETVTYERLVHSADGQKRWFNIRTVPDKDVNNSVQGLYVVGMDIHDIKMAQATLESSEAELRIAMDSLPYPMVYVDRDFRYRMVNKRVEAMLGKSREELLGKNLREVFGEERFAEVMPFWTRALAGETVTAERLIGTDPATKRWMIVRYTPRHDSNNNIIGLYSAATDIDELKRAELDLRRANWLLSSHFENTPLAVIEWDPDFRVRRWSPQAEKIFGWREAEVVDKHYRDWKFVVEGDAAQADAVTAKLIVQGEPRTTSLHRNHRKDGRVIWCEWYNSSLRDDTGRIISVLSLAQDVTTRVLAEERLVHQATHDTLTGLPNRAMLQDRLRLAISRARRGGHRIAAMFIDLDRFKDVNDTLGHRIGDELLREMSARLARVVRESDLLVRLSGDEFMVVLEQITDLESPRFVAAKLLAEIRQPSRIEGHEIHISGSVGISLFPDDAEDVETLMKNADMAMYRAKAMGKNNYQVFSADLAEHGTATRLMENALRSAVVRNEFELYYQPKVDMRTSQITGAEALLRWHHPTRGMVAPGEFIHLAEEAGLVHEIGDWVLDAAFAQARKWQQAGYTELRLAINLAAGQFRATNLAERIRERIAREGCRPQCIEVEVTETGMLRDPEGVGRALTELREMGLRVAIDDFGTGYSSLSHLKRFPIDTLKIDKTFVADILTDRGDTAIVLAVIALARALDMEVVAEGVETEAQRDLLAAQGCDAYQGYLFSRPLPVGEFEALLQRNARLVGRD